MVEGLELPEPFDAEAFIASLARERGRPIDIMPVTAKPNLPCGLVVTTDRADWIVYRADTTAVHRQHILLHEAAHLVCGHAERAEARAAPEAATEAPDAGGAATGTGTVGRGTVDPGTVGAVDALSLEAVGGPETQNVDIDAEFDADADAGTEAVGGLATGATFAAAAALMPHLPADLIRSVLGRTVYSEPDEREAELVASLILQRTRRRTRHGSPAARGLSRLDSVFGIYER
jgi:hypothetical protein